MNTMKLTVSLLLIAFLSSCGSGQVERVKADSSVTSASIGDVPLPATINTDTTTAAPVPLNDSTTITKADTQVVNFPDAVKETDNKSPKPKSH